VLVTCFNRRETTLRCLQSLAEQRVPAGYSLRTLLTDDGSTDGTGDAVRCEFPATTVVQGNGNQYWVGGTQQAWDAAGEADFYLWLNDDVRLRPEALATLVAAYEAAGDPTAIVVGATCDPISGKTATGGMSVASWFSASLIAPTGAVQPCDTFNGNIVLVPRQAEERIGGLNTAFTHFFGDGDYGLRARKAGIPLLVAPGHLGECRLNSAMGSTFDEQLSVRQRWAKLFGPKGYRPPRQWWAFVRSHAPRPKTLYFAVPYVLFWVEIALGGKVRLRRRLQCQMEAS
jgi:GT2 family glycosyltransferase